MNFSKNLIDLYRRILRLFSRWGRSFILELKGFKRIKSPSNDYWYDARCFSGKVIVDVGCADDADLSSYFLKNGTLKVYAVDPTRSHSPVLRDLDLREDRFFYLPFALGSEDKDLIFFHNSNHQSGSLFGEHVNIDGNAEQYTVRCLTLASLLDRVDAKLVDYMKIDIEGAELEVFEAASDQEILAVNQYFIEFHQHAFDFYDMDKFEKTKKRFISLGYKLETTDDVNILFVKNATS